VSPPVFVNYRRADEPFATALLFAALNDQWAGHPVFLDTRFLRQRGDVGPQLLSAISHSELVLARHRPDVGPPGAPEAPLGP
jgi:hypothetical protein